MSTPNPYDDIVSTMAPQVAAQHVPENASGSNPYDAVVARMAEQPAETLRANLMQSSGTPPDQAAAQQRTAQRLGWSPLAVKADPAGAARFVAQDEFPAEQIARNNPVTSQFLQDPQHMAVAHDSTGFLSQIEDAGKNFLYKFAGTGAELGKTAGLAASAPAVLYSDITGNRDAEDWAFRNFVDPWAQRQQALETSPTTVGGKIGGAIGQVAGSLPYMIMTGGEAGAPEAAEALKPTAQFVRDAIAKGFKANAIPGALQLTNTIQQAYGHGHPMAQAIATAIPQWLMSNLAMSVPAGLEGTIAKRVLSGALTNTLLGEAQREEDNAVAPADMQQKFDPLQAFLINPLMGAGLAAGLGGHEVPNYLDEVRASYKAAAAHEILSTIDALSKATPLRERMPEAFHDFMSQVGDESEQPNLYVDGDKFVQALQQSGTPQADIAQLMPDVAKQFPAVGQTEGTLRIPTADFFTHLSGTPLGDALLPEIKLDPEGMTYNQATEFMQQEAEHQREVADQVVSRAKHKSEFEESLDEAMKPFDADLANTDLSKTYQQAASAFHRATLAAYAERTGQLPHEAAPDLKVLQGPLQDAMADREALAQATPDAGVLSQQNEPVAQLAGDELYSEDHPELTPENVVDAAKTWFKEHLQGKTVHRDGLGDVRISGKTWKKVRRGLPIDLDKARLLPAIPDIIAHGEHTGRFPVDKPRADNIVAFHHFEAPVDVDGTIHQVGVSVGEEADGKLVYNLNRNPRDLLEKRKAPTVSPRLEARDAGPSENGKAALKQSVDQDDDDLNLHVLGQEARGQIHLAKDVLHGQSIVHLFENADPSTLLHELGHLWTQVYLQAAKNPDAPDAVREVADGLARAGGMKDAAAWHDASRDEQVEAHETAARKLEAYLRDGKAPTPQLQSVFGRFRAWLTKVYQSVKQLGVHVDADNRATFDRLVASDAAVNEMQQARGMVPLFEDKPESMTDEDWENYQRSLDASTEEAKANLSARALRDAQWISNAREKAERGLRRQGAAARAGIKDQVTKAVDAMRVYRAERYIRTGEIDEAPANRTERKAEEGIAGGSTKLDIGALEKMYGDAPAAPWRYLNKSLTSRDGTDPDLLAERLGYSSGDELVRALVSAEDRKRLIQGLTDQRMLEEHGDLVDPQSIRRAAEAAIHNDLRARILSTELKRLTAATGDPRIIAHAAQQAAEEKIAQTRLEDLNPRQYEAAETRASRQSQQLFGKGDVGGAAWMKRAQLLNNRLAKAAADARDEAADTRRYLIKFMNPTKAMGKAIGAEHLDRIQELLAKFDLAPISNKSAKQRASLEAWVNEQEAQTGVRPAVSDQLATMDKTSWKNLTVAQFRELRDAVQSIEHVGRESTNVTVRGKRVALRNEIDEALSRSADLKARGMPDTRADAKYGNPLTKISAKFVKLRSGIRSGDAALLKMEQLMQWLDKGRTVGEGDIGPYQRNTLTRAAEAEATERTMQAEAHAALRDLGDKLHGAGKDLRDSLVIDNLPRPGRDNRWYRGELIAAALNMGNEGNLRKLLEGYSWKETDLSQAIDRHLSPAEMDFVQGIWDIVGKYGPEIEALEKRQTGIGPKMVQPRQVVTAHGTYGGGYYPIVFDDVNDRHIEEKNAQNTDRLFENNYARPGTARGHTVKRTNYVGPIWLDLDIIGRHINQVTHDLAWREAIVDMNKFLSHPDIQGEIERVLGREYARQCRPWLQAMANNKVYDTSGVSGWEKFYRVARTNATVMGLGYRLTTMQTHALSALANSMGELGTKWMTKGIAQFTGVDRIRATTQFIFDRSPEMAHRMRESDRNVHEAIANIEAQRSDFSAASIPRAVWDGARKYSMYGIQALDMASAMPTWMGAYLKGIAPQAKGGLDLSEEDAIDYANRTVRNAHGGGGTKDLSAVQRDTRLMSMFTLFYSFWSHMYNRQRDLWRDWGVAVGEPKRNVRSFPRLLARSWYYFVLPQVIYAWVRGDTGNCTDGSMSCYLEHAAGQVALGGVGGLPVIRDLTDALAHGRDYEMSPLEEAGQSLVTTARNAYHAAEGERTSKHPVKTATEAAGYLTGAPLGQLSSSTQFLWDVYDGQQDPQGLHDWWTGLETGRLPRH